MSGASLEPGAPPVRSVRYRVIHGLPGESSVGTRTFRFRPPEARRHPPRFSSYWSQAIPVDAIACAMVERSSNLKAAYAPFYDLTVGAAISLTRFAAPLGIAYSWRT